MILGAWCILRDWCYCKNTPFHWVAGSVRICMCQRICYIIACIHYFVYEGYSMHSILGKEFWGNCIQLMNRIDFLCIPTCYQRNNIKYLYNNKFWGIESDTLLSSHTGAVVMQNLTGSQLPTLHLSFVMHWLEMLVYAQPPCTPHVSYK
jgi:hypothetical protein